MPVIVSDARTPMGGFQGCLSSVSALELDAAAIREAVSRAGIPVADVEEVIMGCVLPAGLEQGPARQAALNAGLPAATGCTTINKLCGSGMKAVMLAMREHGLDHAKVNIYGGACAQGHPVGSTGSRIILTLLNALRNTGGRRGIASLCIGGGEATAVAIERL